MNFIEKFIKSVTEEIPCSHWNLIVYHVYKSPPLDLILNQLNSVPSFMQYFYA
jgi:hypothetical protein